MAKFSDNLQLKDILAVEKKFMLSMLSGCYLSTDINHPIPLITNLVSTNEGELGISSKWTQIQHSAYKSHMSSTDKNCIKTFLWVI